MIKLFRNIRQNLLNEGKTSKYIKYVIGEIILVVIGILIALQVSNWNQNRIKIAQEQDKHKRYRHNVGAQPKRTNIFGIL